MKRVGIDIGGTFTDLVWYDEETSTLDRLKVLTSADQPDRSFIAALDQAGLLEDSQISLLLHATTLVTNLLIQRRGSSVGLLTTTGFRDLLAIQNSVRPNPFNYVEWNKRPALIPRELRLEIDERLDHLGNVLRPLDEAQVEEAARRLAELEVEGVAVCFLHSFVNPAHERRAGEILAEILAGVPISLSCDVDPTMREYERTSTTVINSYVQKALHGYVDALEDKLPLDVRFMHSGGGIIPASTAKALPVMLARSGPAAGVLAGVFLADQGERKDFITFDMGGTSCDVALIRDGAPEMTDSIDVDWNIPARTLSIDVQSVGAGGGSIAWIDPGGALMVGPQSSGSKPGPACYGAGGTEPTVTDANLCLGLIAENLLGGRMALSRAAAEEVLERLGAQLGQTAVDVSRAIFRIVNMNMALAIRQITVEKGIDPRDFDLVSFGGAGGQHAAPVAAELGIQRVLFAPQASTFSALGLLTADLTISHAQALFGRFEEIDLETLRTMMRTVGETSVRNLECDVEGASDARLSALLDLRYAGQVHHVSVPFDPDADDHAAVFERFEDAHETLYGTRLGDPAELVNVRMIARRHLPGITVENGSHANGGEPAAPRWVELERAEVPVVGREAFEAGKSMDGPVLIDEVDSTHYVPSGWAVSLGQGGAILAEHAA
ncbi:MAG TPA: hydantoinase/oxoprolinase family protein [Gaiellaceae bacterium]|nr:hydantoinase/oxoprolinase family protein [Gaiellaceae bacterium]